MYAYSAVGDMTVFLLCIVMLLLLRATYTQKSRRYKFVIAALLNLMYISTLSIVFNYYVYPNAASACLTLVYLLHNSLYISLIMQLGLYIFYIFDLIGYRRRWCTCTMILLWAVFIILEMTTAFTGIGFYIEDGVIYDYTHDSLYLIWYILYLGFMAGIILTQNKVIIRKIYTAIILTMGISLFVTISEFIYDTETFTVFSYYIPVLSVVILFHCSSYNSNFGAVDRTALVTRVSSLIHAKKTFSL